MLERALYAANSILITDAQQTDNPIVWRNAAFEALTGYTVSETLGRSCRFLQGKDTDTQTTAQIRAAVSAGEPLDARILNYRKDGSPFWNDLRLAPLYDSHNELTHFVGVLFLEGKRDPIEMDQALAFAAGFAETVRGPRLVLDSDLRVVSANLSFYRLFQVRPDETVGALFYALGGGQWDIPALHLPLREVLLKQTMLRNLEVTRNFAKIGAKTLLLNASALEAQGDLPEHILLTIEDVTHRLDTLQAYDTLQSSVVFARSILDSLSSQVAILDEKGVIVAVNRAWEKFAQENGAPLHQRKGIGINYMRLCEGAEGAGAEDAILMAQGIRAVMEGRIEQFEHEYPCHAPHEERWFTGRVTRMEYGGRLYLVVAHENITKRKLSERALHQSEARYHLLVESVKEYALILVDSAGLISDWNRGAQLIFGYAPDEIQGRPFETLFTMEDRALHIPAQEMQLARGGQHVIGACYLLRKDGGRFYAEGALVPLFDSNGKAAGFGNALRDFTEKHEEQRAVETLNERLRHAMTETHHRVKNNLQMIAALIEMQADRHEDTELAIEYQRLKAHINAMAMVHDILTAQAKKDGQGDALSVKTLLEGALSALRGIAPNHTLRYAITDAMLLTSQGTSLALIVNELVLNAFRHGLSAVQVTFQTENGVALLTVEDDGPGFPAGFRVTQDGNTGLELVERLASWDLRGGVHYLNRSAEAGAQVVVNFPIAALAP